MPNAVDFFDRQFRGQIAAGDFALNPFEQVALPHLRGDVLDLGCGLGNQALAAARAGCRITAFDGSEVLAEPQRMASGLVVQTRKGGIYSLGAN